MKKSFKYLLLSSHIIDQHLLLSNIPIPNNSFLAVIPRSQSRSSSHPAAHRAVRGSSAGMEMPDLKCLDHSSAQPCQRFNISQRCPSCNHPSNPSVQILALRHDWVQMESKPISYCHMLYLNSSL